MKKESNLSGGTRYLVKWIAVIAGCLILGGMLAFYLILLTAEHMGQSVPDKIWAVGMVPLMTVVAIPVTVIVAKQVSKHLSALSKAMESVAGGDLETYLQTAKAKDFKSVYENFNKMVTELQSVETLRTDVVDVLSHELKTPIAALNGFAKLLSDETDEEKRKKYCEIIVRESDRLALLTKNVLLLTKLDSQEIVAKKEAYNLAEQIRETAISMEPQWSGKHIDLSAELVDARFEGDRDLTDGIWRNLIENAIKFTPKNGEIRISMRVSDKSIEVDVSDTGIGMDEETVKRIFDKYYQGVKSYSASGSGLGLSIAKRIVNLSGGKISVCSKVGEGSTFTVSLPKKSEN